MADKIKKDEPDANRDPITGAALRAVLRVLEGTA